MSERLSAAETELKRVKGEKSVAQTNQCFIFSCFFFHMTFKFKGQKIQEEIFSFGQCFCFNGRITHLLTHWHILDFVILCVKILMDKFVF